MKAVIEIFDNSISLEDLIVSTLSAKLSIEDNSINIHAVTNSRQITSEMVIGNTIKGDVGKSAYQTWMDDGHEGSEADFMAWLQKPAADAAEEIRPIVDTYDNVLDAIAHSGCTLDERVDALEKALIAVLSGNVQISELQVRRLGVWDDNNLVLTGAGAPMRAPDRAGQFYIDTTARTLYYSTGNGVVADWKNA